MRMREWTEYYLNPVKKKILNVISLEFSTTRYRKYFNFLIFAMLSCNAKLQLLVIIACCWLLIEALSLLL